MFDTMNIAKKIKQARIDKNMTQMNLADEMGVSYQAVSNWERGNSMPDISKLEDLCRVLDLTVNQLPGMEERTTAAVSKVMQAEELTVEELAEVAPVLPPETVKEETKKARKKKKLDLSRIADMAPFLDEEYLDELIEESELDDLDGLEDLAPFLSKATLEKIVDRASADDFDAVEGIAPFLGKETLEKLVNRCAEAGEVDQITELAPFVSREALDRLVDAILAGKLPKIGFDDLEDLYPFLGKDALRKLAKHLMGQRDLDALEDLMPYV